MKKSLFVATLILAVILCFSFGAVANEPAPSADGYVNDYEIIGLENPVSNGNVVIMTVGQWRGADDPYKTHTFFPGGEALHDDDIIITNGQAAMVLAVGTRNPWGYPAGSVLDAGCVNDGSGVCDTTWSIEFLPDWWDSWSPSNCGEVTFEIVDYDFSAKAEGIVPNFTPVTKAVKVTRVYDLKGSYGATGQNNDKKMSVVTYYGAPQDGNYLYMSDSLENTGDADIWYNGYEGYTGYQGTADGYENIALSVTNKGDDGATMYGYKNSQAVGSYANTKDNDDYNTKVEYMTSLVLTDKEFVSKLGDKFIVSGKGGKSGYQELYLTNSTNKEVEESGNRLMLKKGDAVTFGEYIVVSNSADHSDLNAFIYKQQKTDTESVTFKGIDGLTGTMEAIIYDKDDQCLGWYTINTEQGGSIDLPVGKYSFKIEKQGYCTSAAQKFEVVAGGVNSVTPVLGTEKVWVKVNVTDAKTGEALFAKVGVYNEKGVAYANTLYPIVRYCGNSVYQSEASTEDLAVMVEIPKATKSYLKVFGEGYFFTSNPVEVAVPADKAVEDGVIKVKVEEKFALDEEGHSADVHHHANKNDAFALPKDLVDSQLVSGLDVVTVSDHDYTVNNATAYYYIRGDVRDYRTVYGFIPSVEISCSWAHFNVLPLSEEAWYKYLDEDQSNEVKGLSGHSYAFTDLKYFVKEITDGGASVTANHPWYSYGLFTALDKNAIPGGYVDDYGCLSLNGSYRDQEMSDTINSAATLWTAYLDSLDEDGDGVGIAKIGSKEVKVTNFHPLTGGSDTHDVFTPYITNTGETSSKVRENREEFYSGKVRVVAYPLYNYDEEPEIDVKKIYDPMAERTVAFNSAVVEGQSYVTSGPILNLDIVPNQVTNHVAKTFTTSMKIGSLAGIRDIVVMTDEATGTYKGYKGSDNTLGLNFKRQFSLTNVDAELSVANGIGKAETDPTLSAVTNSTEPCNSKIFNLSYSPKTEGLHWVAICVIDVNGNFAITNPYFVNRVSAFKDILDGQWYTSAVLFGEDYKIINGYEDNTFRPNEDINRAEFAQMLYKTLDQYFALKTVKEDVSFSDVNEKDWFAPAVLYLAQRGIINGYPDGTFDPMGKITRAEIATMVSNFTGALPNYEDIVFDDVLLGDWFYDDVMNLALAGIIEGFGDGTFGPNRLATRAQAMNIIYNTLIRYYNGTDNPFNGIRSVNDIGKLAAYAIK